MKIKVPDFCYFFQDDVIFETSIGKGKTKNINIGTLNLPSCKIVACDPFLPDTDPFVKEIPSGNYPVILNIVHYVDDGDERIGAAKIKFKNSRAIRWEMALLDGQDLSKLEEDEIYGYPVNSGTGSFADQETFRKYISILDDNPQYEDLLLAEMEKNYAPTRDWCNFEIDSSLNIIAFKSGLGDGFYPSYWGYDENNEVCCLVTDFGLFVDE
ncbi:DUF4241 domain-containing protein [Thermoactinomyces intermedius]|uniref:DUF4241 domain-containing protein n=1 Tax=Thermoactinomyces intermedius TaxID=2024 RepID=A0A8I1AI67_THEIN|nr:DUF4241 domain-containing protein [Thermoactinomyces intermedius]MBA4550093.1 DUF4241 domain-containing protein [Thermoactinomyces intermedius]MBA4837729.1 DUF4241 domain-containing protein [Thermoactinomyces intermedius]MBH8596418.1 DUF4241 domain-containing protein [Thermoactinomyces intermedius]